MLSLEEGMNIYHLLMQTLLMDIPGDICEFGVYDGQGSLILGKTLELFGSSKELHLYDSFEGLPAKHAKDTGTPFKQGNLNMVGWKGVDSYLCNEIINEKYTQWGLKLPNIHKGFFCNLKEEELPKQISFAHLDGDFYTSILDSLNIVYPRLSKNAVVVIDDYSDVPKTIRARQMCHGRVAGPDGGPNLLPGVKHACDEFFKDKSEKVSMLYSGLQPHGYFRKI